jgi:hypothetical protein
MIDHSTLVACDRRFCLYVAVSAWSAPAVAPPPFRHRFAFNSSLCRAVQRGRPLSQRVEIRGRQQCRSMFGAAHKRLYSTPAFYSYVWAIVKSLMRRARVNVLRSAQTRVVEDRRRVSVNLARAHGGPSVRRRGFRQNGNCSSTFQASLIYISLLWAVRLTASLLLPRCTVCELAGAIKTWPGEKGRGGWLSINREPAEWETSQDLGHQLLLPKPRRRQPIHNRQQCVGNRC